MHDSTNDDRTALVMQTMTRQMERMVQQVSRWVQEAPRTLAAIEQIVLPLIRELGTTLIAQASGLATSTSAERSRVCACGQAATFVGERPAQVTTLLGRMTLRRPWYHCAACQHGWAPSDAALQLVAGSHTDGVAELLAVLGITHDSFAEAATVVERLTGIDVCPNTVRRAAEDLGTLLVAQQGTQAAPLQTVDGLPAPSDPPPTRIPVLYVSVDGIQTPIRGRGWQELKVGMIYQVENRPDPKQPAATLLHMHNPSYLTSLAEAQTFGTYVWAEAVRRGVLHADEVVVVGDGAAWVWGIAERQFPGAVQILDWYHASTYMWRAGEAIWGGGTSACAAWVRQQLDHLWASKWADALANLVANRAKGDAVETAITYYTNQRSRMDYATYRARGFQIGSGSIESACKQLVTARLKLAGMRWNADGAEAIALGRAYLKSGRWAEAMALRPARQRASHATARRVAAACASTPSDPTPVVPTPAPACDPPTRGSGSPQRLPDAIRDRVRQELAEERARNRKPRTFSTRRQRQQVEERIQQRALQSSA